MSDELEIPLAMVLYGVRRMSTEDAVKVATAVVGRGDIDIKGQFSFVAKELAIDPEDAAWSQRDEDGDHEEDTRSSRALSELEIPVEDADYPWAQAYGNHEDTQIAPPEYPARTRLPQEVQDALASGDYDRMTKAFEAWRAAEAAEKARGVTEVREEPAEAAPEAPGAPHLPSASGKDSEGRLWRLRRTERFGVGGRQWTLQREGSSHLMDASFSVPDEGEHDRSMQLTEQDEIVITWKDGEVTRFGISEAVQKPEDRSTQRGLWAATDPYNRQVMVQRRYKADPESWGWEVTMDKDLVAIWSSSEKRAHVWRDEGGRIEVATRGPELLVFNVYGKDALEGPE